ncbi:MAG: PrgI family protein [Ruminococcus sp.]|nr:PrgI family protein [Ruminococcus sp.]
MIKADIPQDVTEYKEQFFFGLTIRQFVCGVLMIGLAAGTFVIGMRFIPKDVLMYAVILETAPIAAVGFLRYNGMPFEKIAQTVFEFYFGNQRRKMQFFPEEISVHDEIRKIHLAGLERERKAEKKGNRKRRK